MFARLIKHEIIQTAKPLGVIFGIAALVVAVGVVPMYLRWPIVAQFGMVVAMFAASSVPIGVMVYLVVRYYQSMYGRMGYFTMSIPTRGRTLFAAKAIWACLVAALGYAAAFGGFAWIVSADPQMSRAVSTGFRAMSGSVLALFVVLVVLQLVSMIAQGAFAVSYGFESRFGNLGLAGPLIVGVVLYVLNQVVTLAALLFVPLGVTIDATGGGRIVGQGMLPSFIDALNQRSSTSPVLGLGVIPLLVIMTVVFAALTVRTIERHTSLR